MKKILLFVLLFSALSFGQSYHKTLNGANIHNSFRWTFADSAARVAATVAATDTTMFALQLNNGSVWMLRDNSPKVWEKIGGNLDTLTGSDWKTSNLEVSDSLFADTGKINIFESPLATISKLTNDTIRTVRAVADSINARAIKVAGDINSVPLTDYSSTSTVVGWASYVDKIIKYKRVGGTVDAWFVVSGVSNGTTSSITLPYKCTLGEYMYAVGPMYYYDNTVEGDMLKKCSIADDSNVLNLGKYEGWTASGFKLAAGHIRYETTDAM